MSTHCTPTLLCSLKAYPHLLHDLLHKSPAILAKEEEEGIAADELGGGDARMHMLGGSNGGADSGGEPGGAASRFGSGGGAGPSIDYTVRDLTPPPHHPRSVVRNPD